MAREVLSWSVMFCIALKSSVRFAEIRYVSLGSLRFVKVRQSSARFAENLQEPSSFSEGLQGSAGLYEVLRRISKNTNMFYKIPSASGSFQLGSYMFFFLRGSIKFHKDPLGSIKLHNGPEVSMGIPLGSNMVPQGIDRGSIGFHEVVKGFITHHEIFNGITWL